MVDYKEMYLTMFRAAEKARRALLEGVSSMEAAQEAMCIIEAAQLICEEMYITADDA